MIKQDLQSFLKRQKNLLAFSAGVDSTTLFFILQELGIVFDIAIVNYGVRQQAKEEVAYAKELAKKYNKAIFLANAPSFQTNFEAQARVFRYHFFEETIQKHNYTTLLTAHQLDDKLEWLLMRLSQGSGIEGLSGMRVVEQKERYRLIRPLLEHTKEELLEYLKQNGIQYFIDSSNYSTHYLRNQFRPLAQELLSRGKDGFIKSFAILEDEKSLIANNYKTILFQKKFALLKIEGKEYLPYAVSQTLKKLGYLLSGKERESLKKQSSIVAGRQWAIEFSAPFLYISPYVTLVMPKEFKEHCRKNKIPPKVRGYLFQESFIIEKLGAACDKS